MKDFIKLTQAIQDHKLEVLSSINADESFKKVENNPKFIFVKFSIYDFFC